MKVMILAAGKGERMLPLTRDTPKPLLQAGGKALIQHLLEKLAAAGFTDLVINHAWLGEQLEKALGDGSAFGVSIRYSAEHEALETAGGIIKALPLLGDKPFVVVNGDIWTDYSFSGLKRFSAMEQLAHLVMVSNPPQHPEGDYVLDGNRLSLKDKITVRVSDACMALTYSGIAVLHPELFSNLPIQKLPLSPLFESAIKQGRVSAEFYRGEWFDIGTVERLDSLNKNLLQNFPA